MARPFGRLVLWTPRILGILVSLFIGMFALDALGTGQPWLAALADFGIHLVPAVVLLALVAVSFRWEWIGGVAFVGLAIVYALTMSRGRLDWVVIISGPLAVVGGLFLWSWLHHDELHTS